MDKKFSEFFDLLIELEGGYSNIQGDRGGETKYGITKAVIGSYEKSHPMIHIKSVSELTPEEAKQIYYDDYFVHIHPVQDDEIYYNFFDLSVNSGYNAYLRCESSCGDDDIDAVYNWRKKWYQKVALNNSFQKQFLSGWFNRLKRIQEHFQKNS